MKLTWLFLMTWCYSNDAHRLQQYCVLNQILEFHGIAQSQMGRLVMLKEFLHVQRQSLMNGHSSNDDVEVYMEIVQCTFQSLDLICQELRNAASVLRLPSRRRFPYCSHVDHVRDHTVVTDALLVKI